MKFATSMWIILLIALPSLGQKKVGVVLSGGGAKGLAHIGVLKALEEHEIPIDYVVGTSMGGIVAGCYAAGMSPQQIEDIILSDDFLRWVNGRPEPGYNYYFSQKDDNPSFLRVNLSLDSSLNFFWNSTIANDLSLNFTLAEKLAVPSAIANQDFDNLFVPLRVVAADVFTQSQVILDRGILSDALRATQTVPFFYNPIKVDGKYLFDGGVYNNFPIDIAQKEFSPDVIIGSNVSSKVYEQYPYGEDDKLIAKSLLYLLLDKSDPTRVPDSGVYIQPNLRGYSALDFSRALAMIDSGYVQTLRQMDQIKNRLDERRTCENVAEARNVFNSKGYPLIFDAVVFEGFNNQQQRYLNRVFGRGKRPLYFSDVKDGYYKLVSEDYFRDIYPSISFDSTTHYYRFKVARRPPNNFQVDFGGVIASRSIGNIFLGLNYYYFNRALTRTTLTFNAGNFYKSAEAKVRVDIARLGQFSIEPQVLYNNWDYFEGKDLIIDKFSPTVLNRIDRKVGVNMAFPAGRQFKASLYGYYLNNVDRYIDTDVLISTDTLDELKLYGLRTGLSFSTNTLNRKQYASSGRNFRFNVDWFDLREYFVPGSTSSLTQEERNTRTWIRGRVTLEQYFRSGIYSSGYYLDAAFSNQPVLANYRGTVINAPAFAPMQDSRTLVLENFRSFNYVAGGWRNVFRIRSNLDFRLEGYLYKPLESIVAGNNQEALLSSGLSELYFAGTAGLVLHSTIGPISLSLNYYDDPENQLGVLLHVGYLLFNRTSLE